METDQQPAPVQPEGQGGEGNEAPYAEYLNRIPEESRSVAEEAFKAWDANVNRKFGEHAEYRKTWEPYEQLGVTQIPPDKMQFALSFLEAHDNDPQAVWSWAQQYAQENGLTPEQAAELENAQQGLDDLGSLDAQQLQQVLQGQLAPIQQQLKAMADWRDQQEQQARLQAATQQVEKQLHDLEQKHGSEFDREAVETFLPRHIDKNPQNAVQLAWADYQQLVNRIQKSTLSPKLGAGAPPESGGAQNAAPEPIRTLADANRIAVERMRQRT